jgi:hypothetical protein
MRKCVNCSVADKLLNHAWHEAPLARLRHRPMIMRFLTAVGVHSGPRIPATDFLRLSSLPHRCNCDNSKSGLTGAQLTIYWRVSIRVSPATIHVARGLTAWLCALFRSGQRAQDFRPQGRVSIPIPIAPRIPREIGGIMMI